MKDRSVELVEHDRLTALARKHIPEKYAASVFTVTDPKRCRGYVLISDVARGLTPLKYASSSVSAMQDYIKALWPL